MTHELIWRIPTRGDARHGTSTPERRGEKTSSAHLGPAVSDPRRGRYNELDYLLLVARAAALAGVDGLYVPDEPTGDDAWIVAGFLAREVPRLKIIASFDSTWGSAVYAAKNAVSFQRFSGGRFAWHVTPGGEPIRLDELLTVSRGVQTSAPFSFKGRFFEVKDGGFQGPLAGNPRVPVYLSGDDPASFALSARHADTHLLAVAGVDEVASSQRALAAQTRPEGFAPLRLGVVVDLVAREDESEARRIAETLETTAGGGAPVSSNLGGEEAVLWRGLTESLTGARGALVGSYEQVARSLVRYAAAGVTSFVLGGVPHAEEAYRFGEHVLPSLRTRLATLPTSPRSPLSPASSPLAA